MDIYMVCLGAPRLEFPEIIPETPKWVFGHWYVFAIYKVDVGWSKVNLPLK